MGGVARIPYPKDVWTTTGGAYWNAKNAKRNFFILFGGALLLAIPVVRYSFNNEVRKTLNY